MNDTVDIIDKGFSCLVETLGVVNAERFIAMIKRDSFDCTKLLRNGLRTLSYYVTLSLT